MVAVSLQWFLYLTSLCLVVFLVAGFARGPSPKADLVIHNGSVYTMDAKMPVAEAVGVIEGKIAFVGTSKQVKSWIGAQTEVIDLQGQTMTPGFIEGHGHLLMLGYARMRLNLSDVKSYDELVARVAEAVQQANPGEWVLGWGWHQSKWEPPAIPMIHGFQTHQALSRVSPDNPIYLIHASGHAALANAKAMEIASVTQHTPSPDGGEIIKDEKGNPTGIFVETAKDLITRHIPESTPAKDRRALELAMQACIENGLTSFQDASSDGRAIKLYKEFLKADKLTLRLWVMLSGKDVELLRTWYAKGPEIGSGNNFLTIRAIKLYADGALGSRGAWLLEPYIDRPGHTGHAIIPMDTVHQVARDGLKHGFQVCVHAIGDRANREVMDQFERALQANQGVQDHRFRIEHAQHISARDIPRFAQLGVIAAMQGIHMASDMPWAIHRLGPERIAEGAYVWQKLLRSGAKVINGTDTPVEPVNPIASFYASVTRKTLKGEQEKWFHPEQKMSREQALRSYTLDAAYGAFEEDIKGSIEVGKLADFTVFSKDIMKVPDDRLLDTRVAYTIINGKVVYQRNASISGN
jgi:predicted amidohydrolase YtcJ